MAKMIFEESGMNDFWTFENDKDIFVLKPESIQKIVINKKTNLINILCDKGTDLVLDIKGADKRLLDFLYSRGLLTIENEQSKPNINSE